MKPVLASSIVLLAAACGGGEGDPGGGAGGATGVTSGGPTSTGSGVNTCTEVVDSATILDGAASTPYILAIPGGYLVTAISNGEAWVVVVDPNGNVLSSGQLSSSGGQARLPNVFAAGSGYQVLWAQGADVYTRPLDESGAPSGDVTMVAGAQAQEPRPRGAATSSGIAATWMVGQTSIAGFLEGGALTQQTEIGGTFPRLGTDGSSVAVAWSDGGDMGPVAVAPLGGGATVVDGSAALIKDIVGLGDGSYVVSWEDVGGGDPIIEAAKVQPGDSVAAQTIVSAAGGPANWSTLAWSGERLAVAYYQFRSGPAEVVVTFFDGSLNPVGNEVGLAEGAKYPDAAYGPDGALAVVYATEAGAVQMSAVACP